MSELEYRREARRMREVYDAGGATVTPIEAHPRFRRHAEPWLSKRLLAEALGYSTRWVEKRVAEGMPSTLHGKARRFRMSDVQEWLNTREGGAA